MKMPATCARCGKCGGTAFWEIKGWFRTYESALLAAILGLLGIHGCGARREKYRVPVSVCGACLRPLRLQHFFSIFLPLASLGATGLAVGRWCYRIEPNDEYFGPLAWIVPGLLAGFGGWLAGMLVAAILGCLTRTHLVSFDRLYFRFRNKGLHRQFALLNPNWVKL